LGTNSPTQTLPIRIHYTMPLSNSWNNGNLRLKTFMVANTDTTVAGKKYINPHFINADQTKYLISYPSQPQDASWIVLPTSISTTKDGVPVQIIWATAGTISGNVKLEYTIDNAKT